MTEVHDAEGKRKKEVEWSGFGAVPQLKSKITEDGEGAEHHDDERVAEHRVPHVSAGLVIVDVYVEELILVHEIRLGEEDTAEWHEERRDDCIGCHDHQDHHKLWVYPSVQHRPRIEGALMEAKESKCNMYCTITQCPKPCEGLCGWWSFCPCMSPSSE